MFHGHGPILRYAHILALMLDLSFLKASARTSWTLLLHLSPGLGCGLPKRMQLGISNTCHGVLLGEGEETNPSNYARRPRRQPMVTVDGHVHLGGPEKRVERLSSIAWPKFIRPNARTIEDNRFTLFSGLLSGSPFIRNQCNSESVQAIRSARFFSTCAFVARWNPSLSMRISKFRKTGKNYFLALSKYSLAI
jgi:hypothetical protein